MAITIKNQSPLFCTLGASTFDDAKEELAAFFHVDVSAIHKISDGSFYVTFNTNMVVTDFTQLSSLTGATLYFSGGGSEMIYGDTFTYPRAALCRILFE